MMAIIGKNAAAAESKRLDLKGYPAWIARLVIHLAFLVGFRETRRPPLLDPRLSRR